MLISPEKSSISIQIGLQSIYVAIMTGVLFMRTMTFQLFIKADVQLEILKLIRLKNLQGQYSFKL